MSNRTVASFFVLSTIPFVFYMGCSSPPADPDAGGTDASTDKGSKPDLGVPDVPVDEPIPQCVVSGTATDMADVGWKAAKLQVCSKTKCTLGDADDSGKFAVSVDCGEHYHVLALQPATDSRQGSAGIGVIPNVVDKDFALVDPVRIPETGAKTTLTGGAQVVNIDSKLALTANKDDIDYFGETYLAGISIPQAKWPGLVAPGGKTIVAMWALNPWATTSKKGKTIGVKVNDTYGLTLGGKATIYTVDSTTADLAPGMDGTASASDITGATIDRITWVIVAK